MRIDQHAIQVRAGDGQPHALVRADGDQHGGETFVEDVVQIVHRRVQTKFDAQINNIRHFAFDDLGWQAEFRHAQAQHPARHRHGFKYCDRISLSNNVLRGAQATRTRADNGDALFGIFDFDRLNQLARFRVNLVCYKSFESADIDRFVHQAAVAGHLTAMVANSPANAGEGIVHLYHTQRVSPAALADKRDVSLGALMRGAGVAAGSDAALFDGECVGNGLRKKFVG